MDLEKLVSITEYAKLKGVTRQTVHKWLREGSDAKGKKIKTITIGNKKFLEKD